jgi:hypothetical protein
VSGAQQGFLVKSYGFGRRWNAGSAGARRIAGENRRNQQAFASYHIDFVTQFSLHLCDFQTGHLNNNLDLTN